MTKVKRPLWLKLIARIGFPLVIIYGTILSYNYYLSREDALESTKNHLRELTEHNAAKLNAEFEQLSHSAFGLKNLVESSEELNQQEIFDYVVNELKVDKDNIGAGVAFLPNQYKGKAKFANFIHRSNGDYVESDVAKKYDYLREDWFVIPSELKEAYWTEPFWGRISQSLIMVRAFPIFKKGELAGVSYADISLKVLSDLMAKVKLMNGYSFIISKNGTFIYHPNENYVMKESIFSLAKQYNQSKVRELGREMIAGNSGIMNYKDLDNEQKKWIVYTPIKSTNWSFAAVIPEKMILDKVNKNALKQLWVMLGGLTIIILIIFIISRRVSQPLKDLSLAAGEIADGNLETKIENIKGQDEVAALGNSFNKMVDDLNKHIANLTNITKAKEAVESEMRIARSIQESLLPRIFPAFPERKEFDLYAENIAAKEVAGDFYDFFFLNDYIMAVIMADVSGKGISAGLFMAVTRTLLKTVCSADITPAEALNKTNDILCQDNDACMFTTLFLGFYDIYTGKMIYSNAGHDYPLLVSEGGKCELMKTKQDIALGIDEDHEYQNGEMILQNNQILVLYTDGVIEATSSEKVLYGEKRFREFLCENSNSSLEVMMKSLTEELALFQNNEQFDDITLLFLKRTTEV